MTSTLPRPTTQPGPAQKSPLEGTPGGPGATPPAADGARALDPIAADGARALDASDLSTADGSRTADLPATGRCDRGTRVLDRPADLGRDSVLPAALPLPAPGTAADRAAGAMAGLAVGDALGMPTQYLTRRTIAERWGVLDTFHPGPPDNELSAGLPAGRVTDDTDQAVILGRLFLAGHGHVDPQALARDLLAWEERMRLAGSLDLLGPSTLRALSAVAAGASVATSGRWGDTNGASMRIAPIGIGTPLDPLEDLVEAVYRAGFVTHNTDVATAGAAAVAAAVSAAIDGADFEQVLEAAVSAARLGARKGFYVAGADVAARIAWAVDLVRRPPAAIGDPLEAIYSLVGTGVATQEAVPAAFAVLALYPHDPWAVCRTAASLGGDCDTIAAIAGAVAGAMGGASAFPADVVEQVMEVNPDLHLLDLAADLLTLREKTARA